MISTGSIEYWVHDKILPKLKIIEFEVEI